MWTFRSLVWYVAFCIFRLLYQWSPFKFGCFLLILPMGALLSGYLMERISGEV